MRVFTKNVVVQAVSKCAKAVRKCDTSIFVCVLRVTLS